ncbi:MAG: hypothetical protein HZB81_08745 [Deltaproteobacteria bacterium]|nr:hypothetical protein [Deltaproteobacteria bacterium]
MGKKKAELTEQIIKERMIVYLEKNKFKISPVTHQNHGVDIKGFNKKLGRSWFIECKGNPTNKYEDSSRDSYFKTALGQILMRMNSRYSKYGIALPDDDKQSFRKKIKDVPVEIRKKLKLSFFVISTVGTIYHLSPRGKDFKEVSNV